MDSNAPPTPQDLRSDALNAARLASTVRSERRRAMLLNAASEFLVKAALLEEERHRLGLKSDSP